MFRLSDVLYVMLIQLKVCNDSYSTPAAHTLNEALKVLPTVSGICKLLIKGNTQNIWMVAYAYSLAIS